MLTRRTFTSLMPMAATLAAADKHSKLDAAAVLQELREGHRRFASGHAKHPHGSLKRIRETGKQGQHPHAIVLCCSDSRVVPELIFDQGIGDIFTVRVAGNVANEDEIASVEYAAEHFKVPLVVVMGHSQCGAISAVVNRESVPPEIAHLVVHIEEALNWVRARQPELSGDALIRATVERNVHESMNDLLAGGPILRHLRESGGLRIQGCVYQLATGTIEWLG